LVAPHGIRTGVIERVEREVEAHRERGGGRIRLKMNSLVDEQVIDALYRASQAGVRVEIVVRGICALRPGAEGFSENISVRSILGRFLEHSRIMHFSRINEFWIGSADMMHRNLDRRVEALVQVKDPRLTAYLDELLESALDPSTRCWELGPDGQWTASPPEGHSVRDHQVSLMEQHRSP
jgi:polyphosphate kinase